MLFPTSTNEFMSFEYMYCIDCINKKKEISPTTINLCIQQIIIITTTLSKHFKITTMPADGFCLFHCYLHSVDGGSSEEKVEELFRLTMNHMSTMSFEGLDSKSLNEIRAEAKALSTGKSIRNARNAWSKILGDLMPLGLADYTKTQLVIYSGNLTEGVITVTKIPENCDSRDRIHLVLLQGWIHSHYNLLTLLS